MIDRRLLALVLLGIALATTLFSSSISEKINTHPVQQPSEHSENHLPEAYYFAPRSPEDYVKSSPRFSIDDNGVLVTDYDYDNYNIGKWHNPLFIAVYANALYADFLKHRDTEREQQILTQANWLLDNVVKTDEMAVWKYPFTNIAMGMDPGWISGLTQGVVPSVLVRAHALSGDEKYLDLADRALRTFETSVSEGGVATHTSERGAFYEEVAQPGKPSNKILNGHIGALAGLWDYYLYTKSERVLEAFNRGVIGLKDTLHNFDAYGTSYYSLNPPRLAPIGGYNRGHVAQLLWLYNISEDPLFLEYAIKFNGYENPTFKVLAVKGSTNAKKNGMENLRLQGGKKYWSHNEFPTWVELDLGDPKVVTGITLFSGGLESAWPKDYDIQFSLDRNEWNDRIKVNGSAQQFAFHPVNGVYARYIRITIYADNGNNNVVLTGFGVDLAPSSRTPWIVVDWKHFIDSEDPSAIVDGDTKSAWTSRDGRGWIIEDLHMGRSLSGITVNSGTPNGSNIANNFTVAVSADARKWQEVANISGNDRDTLKVNFTNNVSVTRYVKIELKSTRIVTISEISANFLPETNVCAMQSVFDNLDRTGQRDEWRD